MLKNETVSIIIRKIADLTRKYDSKTVVLSEEDIDALETAANRLAIKPEDLSDQQTTIMALISTIQCRDSISSFKDGNQVTAAMINSATTIVSKNEIIPGLTDAARHFLTDQFSPPPVIQTK